MEVSTWLSFIGTVVILAFSPGPSVLLVAANSMKFGKQKVLGTIAGDLTANLCQMLLASLGLASIIVASGHWFLVLKWFGVVYLVYMGLAKILTKPQFSVQNNADGSGRFKKLFVEGFMMSAANPKAIVFFAALFPLFLNSSQAVLPQLLVLGLTFLLIDGISLYFYGFFAEKLKTYLEDQEKLDWQNRIVGSLLIISGLLLSLVKRS